ncbi:MAG: ATP-binding protein [Dehalococcoidia bacterium]
MQTSEPGKRDETERLPLLLHSHPADVTPFVEALRANRDQILARWLQAVERQPFHRGREEGAGGDHIETLYDGLVTVLAQHSHRWSSDPGPRTTEAAQHHARKRAGQGLLASEIVLEFQLLRQEILEELHGQLPQDSPVADLLRVELLLSAALDEAIGAAADDFMATAAHDLRTPLTVLKGGAQMIRRQLAQEAPNQEMIANGADLIDAQVNRMEELLSNLLDVTRLLQDRLDIRPAPTDLRAVVDRVAGRLDPAARGRITIEQDAGELTGNWQASRIEQVVDNLLSNALKYAPEGPIRIRLSRDDGHARLEVSDQGIGMSREEQGQLFRRFYRSADVIERKIDGTGLGLYICHGIVEAHGGAIHVTSPGKGQGTTVIVTLPLAESPAQKR